jgi:hypothetical protein
MWPARPPPEGFRFPRRSRGIPQDVLAIRGTWISGFRALGPAQFSRTVTSVARNHAYQVTRSHPPRRDVTAMDVTDHEYSGIARAMRLFEDDSR